MKLLIVDDVQFMLISLKQLLERNGYKVVSARSGREALRLLEADCTIDVVITDLVMPEMSGLQLYRQAQTIERISDEGKLPAPPFILLSSFDGSNTSSSRQSELEQARHCFAATLRKPVEESALLPVLQIIEIRLGMMGHEAIFLCRLLQTSLDRLLQTSTQSDMAHVVHELRNGLDSLDLQCAG